MNKAMNTIKNMAERIQSTVQTIVNRPKNVEIEFGIKFDAEFGVIIAKATLGTVGSYSVFSAASAFTMR
jgi:hypothetical protein